MYRKKKRGREISIEDVQQINVRIVFCVNEWFYSLMINKEKGMSI